MTSQTLALPETKRAISPTRGDGPLLERYRRGDPDTLARIYDRHAPALAAFLARGFTYSSEGQQVSFDCFCEPSELEDALEETFARAFSPQARRAYDGVSPYETYLIGIARTVALCKLRERDSAPDRSARLAEHERVRQALLDLERAFVADLDDDERSLLFARVERRATARLSRVRARKLERSLRSRFLDLMHERARADQRVSQRG